jgi:hypothetical protein
MMSETAESLESLLGPDMRSQASSAVFEYDQEVATLIDEDPVGAIAYFHKKVTSGCYGSHTRRILLLFAARMIIARNGDV